ncbi:MAG TPA: alpha/beta hydrolase [Methylomirabilota bacterium]|nr:alpha/beta hydrolase [Methylomirabilota bacterium]
MPAVFVHGVPDTPRVWNAVVSRLDRADIVRLSLPGFACPVPDGFTATKEAYVDWLLDRLAALPAPIDLVGHDWGALLVVRAVSVRPELARSWAAGGAPLDAEYVWHQAAKLWQTPEVGEQVMEAMTPAALRRALVAAGVPEAEAAESSGLVDATMKRCILALYRSAVRVGAEWEADLGRVTAPGLVLWGENDPYAAARFGARLAERTGARFVSFPGCSHWWQLERAETVAGELERLWAAAGLVR